MHENPFWQKITFWQVLTLVLAGYFLVSRIFTIQISLNPRYQNQSNNPLSEAGGSSQKAPAALQSEVIPAEGIVLPIEWGDLGKQLVEAGVIDADKFRALFDGGLSAEQEAMLTGSWDEPVILNDQDSRFILDVLWAFGLANQNPILENGEMSDERYGGAGNFASTGGWSLARGETMDHYSKHAFITLTQEQQELVDQVSQNIYRPCCGNNTHFPDCNHGMAMLGLLELMAAQGLNAEQLYQTALAVNSYWFPQTYLDLAAYFKEQGKAWNQLDPKSVLGPEYSSAQGYQAIREKTQSVPVIQSGSGGCGA